MLCSELVTVNWTDRQGRERETLANLEDISLCGVCLQLDAPVALDTVLRIRHPKGEFRGSVRYCFYREIGYFLGVEFLPGYEWSPEAYQPEYLLDLRKLVLRSTKRAIKQADPAAPAQLGTDP
jgi:hypothetical protein